MTVPFEFKELGNSEVNAPRGEPPATPLAASRSERSAPRFELATDHDPQVTNHHRLFSPERQIPRRRRQSAPAVGVVVSFKDFTQGAVVWDQGVPENAGGVLPMGIGVAAVDLRKVACWTFSSHMKSRLVAIRRSISVAETRPCSYADTTDSTFDAVVAAVGVTPTQWRVAPFGFLSHGRPGPSSSRRRTCRRGYASATSSLPTILGPVAIDRLAGDVMQAISQRAIRFCLFAGSVKPSVLRWSTPR